MTFDGTLKLNDVARGCPGVASEEEAKDGMVKIVNSGSDDDWLSDAFARASL
jgi:hypothetical protein